MAGDLIIVVLAAGGSTRMRGADKLLQMVDGKPLLRLMVERALAVAPRVAVTLPPTAQARHDVLPDDPRLEVVTVDDAASGMSASFRAVARARAQAAAGVMFVPADMPELDVTALRNVARTARDHPDRIVRGTAQDGTPGHPVVIPARLVTALCGLTGDTGARDVVRAEGDRVVPVALPGQVALTDLDTPEDWAVWRAARQRPRA